MRDCPAAPSLARGGRSCTAPAWHPNYNGVLGADCDVDAMLDVVRSWDLPARWLISSASAGNIEDTFRADGWVMGDEYPAMIAPIATLHHAGAERGHTVAMLQATQNGFHVYERLGFRTICAFRSWQIP